MEKLTYEQAKNKALSILSFSANTENDLYTKLIQKGADEEDAVNIIEFCREYNLVNDSEYAIKKAKDLYNLKRYGKNRIVIELKKKGIKQADIDNALFQLGEIDGVPEDLIEKKLKGDFSQKNVDKVIRHFIGKGYDLYKIKACIERIIENEI